ncbi:MAG: aminopeptidase [Bacteroidales bacterium]|nr:aminopeptidase [Candidatus Cacconaster merdequi]
MKHLLPIFSALIIASCSPKAQESGVSLSLAEERAGFISELSYSLSFDLTSERGNVAAFDTVRFNAASKKEVVLDFKAPAENILQVEVNGKQVEAKVENEHLAISGRYLNKGRNTISISFIAGEQSLNRREGFLFTLLVPDRARTLFPCFDQPGLKASFSLTLKVPDSWTAVSNTEIIQESGSDSCHTYCFAPTKPLSTYLFSFVAGRFEKIEKSRGGRVVRMYHRETDKEKIAQSDDVFDLVFDSLDWLEEYTSIPYPFSKYDFIVLPDFQYGGMEHAGATLYNDKRIFTGSLPTTDELLERASLIAHETAHMWFGDYVTMQWFNDVWTKEVFANWFAAQIMRPLFPSVNHTLSDLKSSYASAYKEDRTLGSNAIQRPLDNLQDAGLIYCNIIYDKAPVVMDKLSCILGPDNFRKGMREYLRRFAYSNATWDDLVEILDSYTEQDLKEWSRVWVKEAGMPEYVGKVNDGKLEISQEDPFGRGLQWQQELNNRIEEERYWIPNIDGKGYGWFKPDAGSLDHIMSRWSGYPETERMSLLMTLYENSWHGTLDRRQFILWCSKAMLSEDNSLILSSIISYSAAESIRCREVCPELPSSLRLIASDSSRNHELRLMAFRQLIGCVLTSQLWEELYSIWKDKNPYPGLVLGESDYTDLSCQLMVALPQRAEEIAEEQMSRITNPDRKEAFEVLGKAASPQRKVRESLFESFLESPENRRPESRVLSALALLCHRSRAEEAIRYITPALDSLHQIQRTGDIFFPASWCNVLLKNQTSEEARNTVNGWINTHSDTNPLLITKILQAENFPQ